MIAGRETLVEVELMSLDAGLTGLAGLAGPLGSAGSGESGLGSGGASGGFDWDYDEDDFGQDYDEMACMVLITMRTPACSLSLSRRVSASGVRALPDQRPVGNHQ